MIIDSHAHLVMPGSLYEFLAKLRVNHNLHDIKPNVTDEEIVECAEKNIKIMDGVGTDVQLLSPRPYLLMHSHAGIEDVRRWVAANNDVIARMVEMYPTRFRGVGALPQVAGQPISIVFDELDRIIDELGFVGVLLNPDPFEGAGGSPTMADEYWYPLYEKLVEKDIPAHIHSTACCSRETYSEHFISEESLAITSIARSRVFKDFPTLKLMISHGGGSVPYQIGRWRAQRIGIGGESHVNEPDFEDFEETLRRFWFDTVIYSKESLELLFKVVGAERCMFGTERPGSGSAKDPKTGRFLDDVKPVIESIEFLTEEQKQAIFEGNAKQFFTRLSEQLLKASK